MKLVAAFAALALTSPTPIPFVWPTSVAVEPGGSLLVVENGLQRLVRVGPSGQLATVAALTKPYAVVRSRNGSIYVTDGPVLRRIDGTKAPVKVVTANNDIGPIALARNGDVYFTTETALWKLPHGKRSLVQLAPKVSFLSPHGVALLRDGSVLVADTGHHRILRVVPARGKATLFARVATPDGMQAAADGTVYVADAAARRILHLSSAGERLGYVSPVFGDPYSLALAPGGVIYVVDTAQTGFIRRVAPDGTVTTVSQD
jgi:serine/threonine-protein kinase